MNAEDNDVTNSLSELSSNNSSKWLNHLDHTKEEKLSLNEMLHKGNRNGTIKHGIGISSQPNQTELIPGLDDIWFNEDPFVLFREEINCQRHKQYGQWNVEMLHDRILVLTSQLRRVDSYIATQVIIKHEKLVEGAQHTFAITEEVKRCLTKTTSHRQQILALQIHAIRKGLLLSKLLLVRRRVKLILKAMKALQKVVVWDAVAQQYLFARELNKAAVALCRLQNQIENCSNEYGEISLLSNLKLAALENWDHLHQTFVDELKQIISPFVYGNESSKKNVIPTDKLEKCFKGLSLFTSKATAGIEIITYLSSVIPTMTKDILIQFIDHATTTTTTTTSVQETTSSISTETLCRLVRFDRISDVISKLITHYWKVVLTHCHLTHWCQHQLRELEHQLQESEDTNSNAPLASPFSPMSGLANGSSPGLVGLGELAAMRCPTSPTTESFYDSLASILGDLLLGKRSLWHRMEQSLTFILQWLPIESSDVELFLQSIVLVQRFCLEIHIFLSHYDGLDSNMKTYNQFISHPTLSPWDIPDCTSLLNALKFRIHHFFIGFQSETLQRLKSFLCEESWQRLPLVCLHHQDLLPLAANPITVTDLIWSKTSLTTEESTSHHAFFKFPSCWTKSNPFIFLSSSHHVLPPPLRFNSIGNHAKTSSIESSEHLEVSNKGPVMSAASRQFCRSLSNLISLGHYAPFVGFDIFIASLLLLDLYLYSVASFFSHPEKLALLLERFCPPPGCFGGPRLYERHKGYFIQRRHSTLKRLVVVLRTFASVPIDYPLNTAHFSSYPAYRLKLSESNCSSSSTVQSTSSKESNLINRIINEQIQLMRKEIRGFVPTVSDRLGSPGSLWGLAERVTSVESTMSILRVLFHLYLPPKKTDETSSDEKGTEQRLSFYNWNSSELLLVVQCIEERQLALSELRDFIYYQSSEDIFDLRPFVSTVSILNWNGQGHDLAPALDQLRMQLHDLYRKIACSGGGSIPRSTQLLIWKKIGEHTVKSCIDALASNMIRFPKTDSTPEPLFSLAQDFRQLLRYVGNQIARLENKQSPDLKKSLLSEDNEDLIDFSSLSNYIEAHSRRDTDLLSWCEAQDDINVEALLQVIHKTTINANTERTLSTQLEVYFSKYLRSLDESLHGDQ